MLLAKQTQRRRTDARNNTLRREKKKADPTETRRIRSTESTKSSKIHSRFALFLLFRFTVFFVSFSVIHDNFIGIHLFCIHLLFQFDIVDFLNFFASPSLFLIRRLFLLYYGVLSTPSPTALALFSPPLFLASASSLFSLFLLGDAPAWPLGRSMTNTKNHHPHPHRHPSITSIEFVLRFRPHFLHRRLVSIYISTGNFTPSRKKTNLEATPTTRAKVRSKAQGNKSAHFSSRLPSLFITRP